MKIVNALLPTALCLPLFATVNAAKGAVEDIPPGRQSQSRVDAKKDNPDFRAQILYQIRSELGKMVYTDAKRLLDCRRTGPDNKVITSRGMLDDLLREFSAAKALLSNQHVLRRTDPQTYTSVFENLEAAHKSARKCRRILKMVFDQANADGIRKMAYASREHFALIADLAWWTKVADDELTASLSKIEDSFIPISTLDPKNHASDSDSLLQFRKALYPETKLINIELQNLSALTSDCLYGMLSGELVIKHESLYTVFKEGSRGVRTLHQALEQVYLASRSNVLSVQSFISDPLISEIRSRARRMVKTDGAELASSPLHTRFRGIVNGNVGSAFEDVDRCVELLAKDSSFKERSPEIYQSVELNIWSALYRFRRGVDHIHRSLRLADEILDYNSNDQSAHVRALRQIIASLTAAENEMRQTEIELTQAYNATCELDKKDRGTGYYFIDIQGKLLFARSEIRKALDGYVVSCYEPSGPGEPMVEYKLKKLGIVHIRADFEKILQAYVHNLWQTLR